MAKGSSDRKAEQPKAGKNRRHCTQWPNCVHTRRCKRPEGLCRCSKPVVGPKDLAFS